MIADIPAEQVRDALERVAAEILAEAQIASPPIDAFALAARLRLPVARDASPASFDGPRARFVRLGGAQPAILLADDPRPERRHWAVAHEIGEAHAHRVFAELSVEPVDAPEARESVANRLASCLLLPHQWFFADGIDLNWDLPELKTRYATASHELIARRMLEMPVPVIITLWDQARPIWRRGNAGRTPPLAACERDARQAASDFGAPTWCEYAELPAGVADVRAWPIHEPGWKREIIRTQLWNAW